MSPTCRGGLLLFAVAVAMAGACGPAGSISKLASPRADIVVETAGGTNLRFVPEAPMAGSSPRFSLLFRNVSTLAHNLTFSGLAARTETIVAPGTSQTIEVTVPGPGSYAFVCTIHADMKGALTIH